MLLPIAAIFLAVAVLAGALATGIGAWASRTGRAAHSSAVWAALMVGPLLVALMSTLALVAPEPGAGCHCLRHDHHLHICLLHPALASPLVYPALAVLGLWLLAALPRMTRQLIAATRGMRTVHRIRRVPPRRIGDTQLRILPCGSPSAFTAGAVAPVIVVDQDLWQRLSTVERAAIVHHESCHVSRADTLTLLVLRCCLALQPWLPSSLLERWRHATEIACDRHAGNRVGDPSVVAEALVRVSRLRGEAAGCEPLPKEAALGAFGAGGLEARVHALLAPEAGSHGASRATVLHANDVLRLLLPALGVGLLVCFWPGDLLHHAIETVIGLVSH
ncbi:MAG: M56 family metallopeptidase [Polyangiaceae bacterium]